MVEWLSIQHPNAANADDSLSIANGAILAVVTATDGDSDTSSASTAIGNLINFQDSGPILTAVDNINIQNSGDVAATGGFHFLLGADGALATNDVLAVTTEEHLAASSDPLSTYDAPALATNDVLAVTGSATVNGAAVTNYLITETSESATTAIYTFSFDYPNGSGTTAHGDLSRSGDDEIEVDGAKRRFRAGDLDRRAEGDRRLGARGLGPRGACSAAGR